MPKRCSPEAEGGGPPRLVIAGTASGVGKTTITSALIAALRRRGLRVAAFKVGPDYLDPQWLGAAAGGPAVQLDAWLMGRDGVLRTFQRHAAGADIAIIEGMMGCYDGIEPTRNDGSTAEVATWLAAPVVLVADAFAVARSLAAVVHGFRTFPGAPVIGGVIANRVGGAAHARMLRVALGAVDLLGAVEDRAVPLLAERHLGVVVPPDIEARIERLVEQVAPRLDLDGLIRVAGTAPPLAPVVAPTVERVAAARIAVAYDEAFSFYYSENLALLEAAGAELIRFSPLSDPFPTDADALYVGGGYPELYAERLAEHARCRADVAAFARERPVLAECGGFMWLSGAIETPDQRRWPMCGVFPGLCRVGTRLAAIGYTRLRYCRRHWSGPPDALRFAHQFRYSVYEGEPEPTLWETVTPAAAAGFLAGRLSGCALGSWMHQHWGRTPEAAQAFVAAAAA